MIKIEMEDSEPVVAQLRTLTEVMQRKQAEDEVNRLEGHNHQALVEV